MTDIDPVLTRARRAGRSLAIPLFGNVHERPSTFAASIRHHCEELPNKTVQFRHYRDSEGLYRT
jgi:hypothetical protein